MPRRLFRTDAGCVLQPCARLVARSPRLSLPGGRPCLVLPDSLVVCLVLASFAACGRPRRRRDTRRPTRRPIRRPTRRRIRRRHARRSHEPVKNKELMITDLSVVEDARATTAGAVDVRRPRSPRWPDRRRRAPSSSSGCCSGTPTRPLNTFTVSRRQTIRSLVIDPWKTRDGQPGAAGHGVDAEPRQRAVPAARHRQPARPQPRRRRQRRGERRRGPLRLRRDRQRRRRDAVHA